MIKLTIAGGLGNQMFEYAYARALSEEFKDPQIAIDPYFNAYYKMFEKIIRVAPEQLNYQLNLFELNPNVTTISSLLGWAKGFREIVPGVLIRFGIYNLNTTDEKFRKITRNGKFKMLDKEYTYYPHSEVCTKKQKKVLGWFQSEKYFSNVRPILLKEFQFKDPPSPKNQDMLGELSSCNSVCVHIRRGDLVDPHNSFRSYITRPGESYYKEGMRYIAERVDNPVFYIFSNGHTDFEWFKSNYKFQFPVNYVDLGNPGYDDMRLMYGCKHFVISKSSFSWWGSYMSQNPGKIVVAPDMEMGESWLKDKDSRDFYRDDMVKIRVNSLETR